MQDAGAVLLEVRLGMCATINQVFGPLKFCWLLAGGGRSPGGLRKLFPLATAGYIKQQEAQSACSVLQQVGVNSSTVQINAQRVTCNVYNQGGDSSCVVLVKYNISNEGGVKSAM